MTVDDLIFIGLNGWVAALDRDSGGVVWCWNRPRRGDVTLLLDGDRLIASVNGYLYCLDPLTGALLWENELRGYGMGICAMASVRGNNANQLAAAEEEQRRRRARND